MTTSEISKDVTTRQLTHERARSQTTLVLFDAKIPVVGTELSPRFILQVDVERTSSRGTRETRTWDHVAITWMRTVTTTGHEYAAKECTKCGQTWRSSYGWPAERKEVEFKTTHNIKEKRSPLGRASTFYFDREDLTNDQYNAFKAGHVELFVGQLEGTDPHGPK